MDYWNECISEAMDESGIVATEAQIKTVADIVSGAHQEYGMAFGHDAIPNPMIAEIEQIKARCYKELAAAEYRENCYRDSVAERRGVSRRDVYLENGAVRYDRR